MKIAKALHFLLFILLFSGCGGMDTGVVDLSSQSQPEEVVAASGAKAGLKLTIPDSSRGKIVLDADNIDFVKSVELVINGVDVGRITKLPFEFYYDGARYITDEVQVVARALNFSDETEEVTKLISNGAGSGPINDPSCFANPDFDSCLFYKNPVAQNRGPLQSKVTYGSDLGTVQVFGVRFRGLTYPDKLQNNSLRVTASAGTLAKPTNGKWNFDYKSDYGKHHVAQAMAFYWLNEQIEYMKTNSGAFYAENKNITVDAFSSSVQNNAYWDGSRIVMGNFGPQELALSSEVYLHEMGHANLDFATNGRISITRFCPTKFGCIGAIHEGMADAHAFILFPDDPAMAQTVNNTMAGWTNRDPRKFLTKNLDYFFTTLSGNGEVHGMGTAYAVILWKIMKDPIMIPKDFETMFSMHLPRLTSSSDFKTAKSIWINLSDTRFAGKYSAVIKQHFESIGVL